MIQVKQKFDLISSRSGQAANIMHISKDELLKYSIPEDDLTQLRSLVMSYIRSRGAGSFVKDKLHEVIVVKMPDYPLNNFTTTEFIPVVNISNQTSEYISDYLSSNAYSLFLYSLVHKELTKHRIFEKDIAEHIINLYTLIMFKYFGKKHGLTGSHNDLVDALKILITIYVYTAIMGEPLNDQLVHRASSRVFSEVGKKLKIDESIKTPNGLFKLLKDNNIMPISANSFISTMITRAGTAEPLAIFEDCSRLFAFILASNVVGSNLYSNFIKKISQKTFDKFVDMGIKNLQRIK